jgi:hypothetical protein
MRLSTALAAALYSSAILVGAASAQEEPLVDDTTPEVAAKPTFTVSSLQNSDAIRISSLSQETNQRIANRSQSPLPRTIHRRLGVKMDAFTCQEGGLQE